MTRCYNCGLQHMTQNCPSFGPRYPGPGKTSQDYGDEVQRIANLFAADIIREHQEGHVQEEDVMYPVARVVRTKVVGINVEKLYRNYDCHGCGSLAGKRCVSVNGRPMPGHRSRREQYHADLEKVFSE